MAGVFWPDSMLHSEGGRGEGGGVKGNIYM